MGFFDDILVENKSATPAADQTTATATVAAATSQSPADLLIIDDSVSVEAVPDTVQPPADTFVSAFPEEAAKDDLVLFDETPATEAVETAEIKAEETVPAEVAPAADLFKAEPTAEIVQEEPMSFIAEASEPVVEAKEAAPMATAAVSDTMSVDVDETLKATIAQLEAGVANNDEKIQALKSQNESANAERERVLAEAKAESERILAVADAAAAKIQEEIASTEASISKIETNGARAKEIIKKLTKEIAA